VSPASSGSVPVAVDRESGAQVLIVDADVALLRALGVSMKAKGFAVIVARRGEDALGLIIDLASKRVTREGSGLHLTPKEWDTLEVLVRNPGKRVSQQQLLHEVWGPGYDTETEYLRVLMARVRRKLESDPSRPRHFRTEPGMGYRFVP